MAPKRQRVVVGNREGVGGSGAGGRNPRSSSSSDSGGGNGGPRFISDEAREKYAELLGRPIARERGLLPTASDGNMLVNIQERGWEQVCEIPDPVPMTVVREFYANASVEKNGISQVRGFRVDSVWIIGRVLFVVFLGSRLLEGVKRIGRGRPAIVWIFS